VIGGNLIVGPLTCSGNNPPPTNNGAPNTVFGRRSGQCAGL
jgi:hexosaminidase